MKIVLTVADHEQNGFVQLASWRSFSEADARNKIGVIDAAVPDEARPDLETAPYAFVLDLIDERSGDLIDTSKLLPTQMAMRLASDQVQAWLSERPEPDDTYGCSPPILSTNTLTI